MYSVGHVGTCFSHVVGTWEKQGSRNRAQHLATFRSPANNYKQNNEIQLSILPNTSCNGSGVFMMFSEQKACVCWGLGALERNFKGNILSIERILALPYSILPEDE